MSSHQPWVEKYRPRNVDEVACQEEVVSALCKSIQTGNLPHLLFYGPPGTGKTSTALAVARQLYGPELVKSRVLELNASDERGIGVVRGKIKSFAAVAVGQPAAGYPSPPYKLLILDEADAMTEDAQNALRRTMENHSKVTRFCFICNYVSRIIDPIISRCAKFRFKPLDSESMFERLKHIAGCEGLVLGPGSLDAVATCSSGDMRKAVTLLQCASRLHGARITPDSVMDAAGAVPPDAVASLVTSVRPPTGSFDTAAVACRSLVKAGYPALQVMTQMAELLYEDDTISDLVKAAIAQRLAAADKALADGADEALQLMDVASATQRALAGLPPVAPQLLRC